MHRLFLLIVLGGLVLAFAACGGNTSAKSTASASLAADAVSVTTLAGEALAKGSADGTGTAARFMTPDRIAIDRAGDLYVTDWTANTVRKITPGGVVTTIAGKAGVAGSADGTGASARFDSPEGVAVAANGDLYVTGSNDETIRKITPAGVVTTTAGKAGVDRYVDGTRAAARFDDPSSIAIASDGDLYVTEYNLDTIRKITPAGVVTTFAGKAGAAGSADGSRTAARFNNPSTIAFDSAGNLYVTDSGNQTIRKITPAGAVTTVAGKAGSLGSADGVGATARFDDPGASAWTAPATSMSRTPATTSSARSRRRA